MDQWRDAGLAFRELAEWIEANAVEAGGSVSALTRTICLVDPPRSPVNPVRVNGDLDPWAGVLGMLLLAFPEVSWAFLGPAPRDCENEGLEEIRGSGDLNQILRRAEMGESALFDGRGLRQSVILRMKSDSTSTELLHALPVRCETAAAIDDEREYALMHAYVAYRFGFRCHVVTSYGTAGAIVGKARPVGRSVSLVLEDLYLGFDDQFNENGYIRSTLSDLRQRDEVFPDLARAKARVLVTAGRDRAGYGDAWSRNVEYLSEARARGQWNAIVFKPSAGIYDLWRRAGLDRKLVWEGGRGTASGYVWPPARLGSAGEGHSAPGRLLTVAECLLSRAEKLAGARSVEECVYGATLALDAQQLLGNRAPSTSLHALALRHTFEAQAECTFYGVEYNLDVDRRFVDIERDVRSIGANFNRKGRDLSELNARIAIVTEVTRAFRDAGQFDEELLGLSMLRKLHTRLQTRKERPWSWLLWPVRAYIDFLLHSLGRFSVVILFWLFIGGLLFATTGVDNHDKMASLGARLVEGLTDAVITTLGLQPPHEGIDQSGWFAVVTLGGISLGWFHLAIFVSHLYSRISRR